jgi:hypothetical protein
MDEKGLFTKFWTNESNTTRKVLGRIPEGSDYRPDEKSRTAHEIAWQIVCEEKMIIDPGASSSTSSTTAGRSRHICARWDRRCRRSTGRAGTSRSDLARRQSHSGCKIGAMKP